MRSDCSVLRVGNVGGGARGSRAPPRARPRLVSTRHTSQRRTSRHRLSRDVELGSLVSPTCALARRWIRISARCASRLRRDHLHILLVAPGAARKSFFVALASSDPPQRVEARSLDELLQASYRNLHQWNSFVRDPLSAARSKCRERGPGVSSDRRRRALLPLECQNPALDRLSDS